MVLRKNAETGLSGSCNTTGYIDYKLYDSAVVGLLCVAHHYAPSALSIGSNRSRDEWSEGIQLAEKVLGEEVNIHIWDNESEDESCCENDSSDSDSASSDEEDSR